uniref:Uncharacterized protein n=1 Tax=Onchocerca volvulus TaxID=6282 RepID=A0A8R1XRE5_ONCVO
MIVATGNSLDTEHDINSYEIPDIFHYHLQSLNKEHDINGEDQYL